MSKIVVLRSVAKEYLSSKFAGRRNQKMISLVKFATVFCFLISVLASYAYTITMASTSGYFLEEAKNTLEDVKFATSIERLEVVKKQKSLRNDMRLHYSDSWFQGHGSNMVTVNAYPTEYVQR